MAFLTVGGGELIFREWSDTDISQLILLFLGWFCQFLGILLLLGSHTNSHSMYPITQLNDPRGGQLVRVSNVDLDFDSDSDGETHTNTNLLNQHNDAEELIESVATEPTETEDIHTATSENDQTEKSQV